MTDIEIPLQREKDWRYRFFEMLPGLLSWTILLLPFILSQISPHATVFFILTFLLMWFAKAIAMNVRVLQGWRRMQEHQKLPWPQMVEELEAGAAMNADVKRPEWHYDNLLRLQVKPAPIRPSELIHAVMIATYNESRAVLEPTIQALMDSSYDMKKVILVLAYEERGGEQVEAQAKDLINDYKHHFYHAMSVKHPKDIPGEVVGKGGNITYAGRKLEQYLAENSMDPLKVVVTTLDSDNRPHTSYLAALSYTYCVCPDPVKISFQPIAMFTNNIWDAPAPMRVIATGNSFWMIIATMRQHLLRNFSSHAQSMQTLIDTDYWSVRTIVEDGHQYWRTYFRYDGQHEVYPIYLPVYQDAVLSTTLWRTLKAQFVQLRRWAWGASDIAYVIQKGFLTKNRVNKLDLSLKLGRLTEGHVSWATAPLVLAFSAFIPRLVNSRDIGQVGVAFDQLPHIASRIQTIAMIGIVITLFLSLKALPPKPKRYKAHRTVLMILQWFLLPVTSILYNSFAALYSQTRLMIGKYIGKFDVTEKTVFTEDKSKITSLT